jgi:hypothetical protein
MAEDRIEDIVYVSLILSGIGAIYLLVQTSFDFSLSGIISYSVFGVAAAATGIAGMKRNLFSKRCRRVVRIVAIICCAFIAWWLMEVYFFAGKPA